MNLFDAASAVKRLVKLIDNSGQYLGDLNVVEEMA